MRIFDATFETYLTSPAHTRAVMIAVFRLGWLTPVIRERDRFARLLAWRVRASLPHLPERDVVLRCELLCDAAMGVMLSELWRERSAEDLAAVRRNLLMLIETWVKGLDGAAPASAP